MLLRHVTCPALLALASTAHAQTCFESAHSLAVGSYPDGIVSADFNGDGAADLAIVNYTSNTAPGSVSVLLNLGQGTFAPQAVYNVGNGPEALAVGDFDGDGFPDLAVANTWGASFSVLRNLGDGTFAPAVAFGPVYYPSAVVWGDFNGDGFNDVALGSIAGGQGIVTIFFNLGTGAFGAPQTYHTGGVPDWIEAADLDGDGLLDLVTANPYAGTISVLLNQGSGVFNSHVEYAAGIEPRQVRAADFDGDGDLDLAVANAGGTDGTSGSLSLYFNTGAGVFAPQVVTLTHDYTVSLTSGDFDGDGAIDLVLANENVGGNLWVLHNQGSGTFVQVAAVSAGILPYWVTSADLDGDGVLDLAVARWPTGTAATLRNCSAIPSSFCFGDGSSGACPCGSNGVSGSGCENSVGTGGALLATSGQPSLGNDTLVLLASDELDSATSIFLQGDTTIAPAAFGDGLRCIGGHLRRLYTCDASNGTVSAPPAGVQAVSTRSASLGDTIAIGTPRYYQVYYRDPSISFCPGPQGNTWNVTPAVSVHWVQ